MRKRKRFGIDIESIFEPSSVAIIGASEADGSPGTAVLRNMLKARSGWPRCKSRGQVAHKRKASAKISE